jgi:acyl-coenzyme A synthetase/AMP-(fatty) acid ligase
MNFGLRQYLEMHATNIGHRVAARHNAASVTFSELSRMAEKISNTLEEAGIPRLAPVYLDSTDDNWCSYLTGFCGLIAGDRVCVLAPRNEEPLGTFPRLIVGVLPRFSISLDLPDKNFDTLPEAGNEAGTPRDIVFTSGTTSESRSYIFSDNHLFGDRRLASPRHHLRALHFGVPFETSTGCHGIALRHLKMGIESICMDLPGTFSELASALAENHVFEISSTPFSFRKIPANGHNSEKVDSVRLVRLYAGTVPEHLWQFLETRFPNAKAFSLYGLTEAGINSIMASGPDRPFLNSTKESSFRVRSMERDDWANIGEIGEIVLVGNVDSGSTPKKIFANLRIEEHSENWTRTGDLGTVDQGGSLKIVGRSNDIVEYGGERHNANTVSDLLKEYFGLEDVIVFNSSGIPDRVGVILEKPATIANFSMPFGDAPPVPVDSIVLMDNLPRTSLGKISRVRALCSITDIMERNPQKLLEMPWGNLRIYDAQIAKKKVPARTRLDVARVSTKPDVSR